MRIERALDRLQEILAKRGIASTATALGLVMSQHGVAAAPAGLASTITSTTVAKAAAATTVGTVGTWFSRANLQFVLVCAVIALLGVALLRERSRLDEHRTSLALAQERLAWQQREQQQLGRQLQVAQNAQRAAMAAATAADPILAERERLDLVVRKGELDSAYAGLFRRLRLDPVRLDQLKVILVNRSQAEWMAGNVAGRDIPDLTPADEAKVIAASNASFAPQIAALLGAEKTAIFEHYPVLLDGSTYATYFSSNLLVDPSRDQDAEAIAETYQKYFPASSPIQSSTTTRLAEFRAAISQHLTPQEQREVKFSDAKMEYRAQREMIERAAASKGLLKLQKSAYKYYPSTPVTP